MTIGSLFSGIGGLELGLERAGFGPVLWQVEIDPFRRYVLERHWQNAARWNDVRAVGRYELPHVDVICGGFPCQDVSDASRGRGGGMNGEKSSLWFEYARIVAELRPTTVVVENVGGAAVKRWLPQVRRDLHMLGYRTRALRVDARDVGAPHGRPRVFVIANPYAEGKPAVPVNGQVASVPAPATLGGDWRHAFTGPLRMADGIPRGLDRVRALGDAVVPACAELIGRMISTPPCGGVEP